LFNVNNINTINQVSKRLSVLQKKLRIKQQTIFTSALFEIQPFLTVYEMRLLHWEKKNKQNKKIKKKPLYLKEPHIDFKYLRN